MPKTVITLGQAADYLDAWYAGAPAAVCLEAAMESDDDEIYDVPMDDELSFRAPWTPANISGHPVFHRIPAMHARYLVGAHRAGVTVYGMSPVARACNEHLFSLWPAEIFKGFDSAYRNTLRTIRGPGIAVDLSAWPKTQGRGRTG